MLKKQKRRKLVGDPKGPGQELREHQKRELARAVKTEKAIQKLTRALEREIDRTEIRLEALAVSLGARVHAIEAEREADAALRG